VLPSPPSRDETADEVIQAGEPLAQHPAEVVPGSSTSFAAICTTRSRMLGIPNGRSPPLSFGMYTRLTGPGRYRFAFSPSCSSFSSASLPRVSMSSKVSPSGPGAPPFALQSA
jgi:hypothetical protein